MKQLRLRSKLKYLAILLIAALLLGNRGFRRLVNNFAEYRRLQAERAGLARERGALEKQLKETAAKPAIEKAARGSLGLIRPGETEYRFPPPKESDK